MVHHVFHSIGGFVQCLAFILSFCVGSEAFAIGGTFVSHKLRTPLVFIRMFPQLCRQGLFGSLDKRQNELVETLDKASYRMEDMVNQLISFIS